MRAFTLITLIDTMCVISELLAIKVGRSDFDKVMEALEKIKSDYLF